jgi:hypothetical protein
MLLFLPAETMRISQGEECGHKSTDSSVAAIGCGKVHPECAGLEIGIPRSSLCTPTTFDERPTNATWYNINLCLGIRSFQSPFLHGTNRARSIWRLKSHSAEVLPRRPRCWSMIKYSPDFSFNGSSGGLHWCISISRPK